MKLSGKKHRLTAYGKDIRRTIRHERRRFLAIMLITLLGVMMFSGLGASCEDLRVSADTFFDAQNLHDLTVLSTLGLTDEDVEVLQDLDVISDAEGIYSEEVSAEIRYMHAADADVSDSSTAEIAGTSVPDSSDGTVSSDSSSQSVTITLKTLTKSGIDRPYVLEGTLPSSPDEIAATEKFMRDYDAEIGDVIELKKDSDDKEPSEDAAESKETTPESDADAAEDDSAVSDAEDTDSDTDDASSDDDSIDASVDFSSDDLETAGFTEKTFTITGIVTDVTDVDNPFGSVSYRTDSSASDVLFVLPDAVESDYYTAVVMTVADVSDLFCYSDSYEDKVKAVRTVIEESIREDREDARSEEIRSKAQDLLDEAKSDAEEQLGDAKKELKDGEQELLDKQAEGEEKIADGEQELADKLAEAAAELEDAQKKLDASLAEAADKLNAAQKELDSNSATLKEKKKELASAKKELASAQKQLDASKETLDAQEASTRSTLSSAITQLTNGISQIESALSEIESGSDTIETSLTTITESLSAIDSSLSSVNENLQKINDAISAAEHSSSEGNNSSGSSSGGGTMSDDGTSDNSTDAEDQSGDAGSGSSSGAESQPGDAGSGSSSDTESQSDSSSDLKNASGSDGTSGSSDNQSGSASSSSGSEDAGTSPAELAAKKESLEAQKASLQTQKAELEAQKTALETQEAKLVEQKSSLETQKSTLKTQLNTALAQQASAEAQFQKAEEQISEGQKTITANLKTVEEGEKEIAAAEKQLAAGQESIDEGWDSYESGKASAESQIADGWEQYESGKAEGEQELADAREELAEGIADGREELDDGWAEYNDALAEFNDAIADAQAEIDDLDTAAWYIQDRSSLSGYANIGSDADSIEAIGTVFPIVFFVVAILISLTAITRMVDEDRGLIGTYKSLGYTDHEIRRKYIVYALAASGTGAVLGTVCAFVVLPEFIFTIFGIMYLLPSYELTFLPVSGLLGPAIFIAGILFAALAALRAELVSSPASLMRPKSPRAGSRVLLERVTVLWRRLSFLNKVTARNLFRYKKRMFMTIFGIAGCMSLLLFGFAIKDSVSDLRPRQYKETIQYDLIAVSSADDNEALVSYISDDAKSYMNGLIDSVKIAYDESELSATLIVVPDGTDISEYVSLKNAEAGHTKLVPSAGSDSSGSSVDNASSHAGSESGAFSRDDISTSESELSLSSGDIYITLNAGNVLGFSGGDTVSLQLSDLQQADVEVTALVKNYLGNFIYMNESTWESFFEDYEPNGVLVNLNDSVADQAAYAAALKEREGVISATSTAELSDQFAGAFQLINAVVYIVIGMSAALAFVVLFTLSTTNISEREREIATIKVLGFFDREVHLYIDKETVILTLIGIVIGLPLGWAFAQTLTSILNLPSIYLAVSLHTVSYFYAAGLTLLFAFAVNRIMDRVLNRIDPALSLKSVE